MAILWVEHTNCVARGQDDKAEQSSVSKQQYLEHGGQY